MKTKIQIPLIKFFFLLIWMTNAFSCQNRENNINTNQIRLVGPEHIEPQNTEIIIQWFGHSCFMITTPGSTKILMDPVEFKGYHMPEGIKPDVVTVSHNHPDHNRTDVVNGEPEIIPGCSSDNREVIFTDRKIKEVRIYTVPSYHDPGRHGVNAIFVFEFNGKRIVHLGDLGTTLSESQIEAIGKVDILMIPVGGQFTISGEDADMVIEQLNVNSFVFPMHYKTEAFSLPYSAEDFIRGKENYRRITGNKFSIDVSDMPEQREIILMDYQ